MIGVGYIRKSKLEGKCTCHINGNIGGECTHNSVHLYNFAFRKATTYNNQPIVLRTVRGDCSMKDRRNNKIILKGGHHANED